MPGWHEATKAEQGSGQVQMVGIIQEQHPDRTKLFMQWKKMQWPILVDSLNLLGTSLVPLTFFIDEHGIIRASRPRHGDLAEFLATSYEAPEKSAVSASPSDLPAKLADLRSGADQRFLSGEAKQLDGIISDYSRILDSAGQNGPTHFRLGVAYRARYDSGFRREGDFSKAVQQWAKALDIDPNQYIWRRRIQQYGPRLDKPYPFYDWVPQAREEIMARGETPVELTVEPGGAEFARPARDFDVAGDSREAPDPRGRILRDEEGLILAETVIVPDTSGERKAARVHIVMRPNLEKKAHWNNEVEDLVFWVEAPEGWKVDSRYLTVPNPREVVSQETRRIEFEIRSDEGTSQPVIVPAYALYYVCEDVDGTCLYRRQDVNIKIP